MRFDYYIPCDALRPYVKTFAISEGSDHQPYRVLPDTGVVLGFQYRGRISTIENGKEKILATTGISGLHDAHRMFKNNAHTGSVLVYFRETAAPVFFAQPVHELFRLSVSLDQFMLQSELMVLEEQLMEAADDPRRIEIVEGFLISRMKLVAPDTLILGALEMIFKSNGNIRIAALAKQLNTSASPLEKRFRSVVGTTPKKFAAIVRFRNMLRTKGESSSLTDLGYESGFFDQSHFIKEFKRFTGDAPGDFFSV